MRLIDADALMHDIVQYHLSDGKFQYWVEVRPTIDAIPIQWINDWYDRYMYVEVGDLLNDWIAERKEE